jgi:hypothetical protein
LSGAVEESGEDEVAFMTPRLCDVREKGVIAGQY